MYPCRATVPSCGTAYPLNRSAIQEERPPFTHTPQNHRDSGSEHLQGTSGFSAPNSISNTTNARPRARNPTHCQACPVRLQVQVGAWLDTPSLSIPASRTAAAHTHLAPLGSPPRACSSARIEALHAEASGAARAFPRRSCASGACQQPSNRVSSGHVTQARASGGAGEGADQARGRGTWRALRRRQQRSTRSWRPSSARFTPSVFRRCASPAHGCRSGGVVASSSPKCASAECAATAAATCRQPKTHRAITLLSPSFCLHA
eukprot:2942152-Rhodomonas_salina.1